MAKLEKTVVGDFLELKKYIEDELPKLSTTFSFEEGFEGISNGRRYWVAACERYAYTGRGRASLNITLLEEDDGNHIMATSTGASQAMFFKINTWSEESFLDTLRDVLEEFEK